MRNLVGSFVWLIILITLASCSAPSIGSSNTGSKYTLDLKINQANYGVDIFDEYGNHCSRIDVVNNTIDIYANSGDIYYLVPLGWVVVNYMTATGRSADPDQCDSYIGCIGPTTFEGSSGFIPDALPENILMKIKSRYQTVHEEYYQNYMTNMEDWPITPIDINTQSSDSWYLGHRFYVLAIP